jgi:hypothetical protein
VRSRGHQGGKTHRYDDVHGEIPPRSIALQGPNHAPRPAPLTSPPGLRGA